MDSLVRVKAGPLFIRSAKLGDLPAVADIEWVVFDYPYTAEELRARIVQRGGAMLTAIIDGKVVGFLLYRAMPPLVEIFDIAVLPEFQGMGIGWALNNHLLHELDDSYIRVLAMVRDSNLAGHKFFSRQLFKCTGVVQNHWTVTDEDAYRFEFYLDCIEK